MGTQHRHADAGHVYTERGHIENLAALLDHLPLFLVVAVLIYRRVMAKQIERINMRQHLRLRRFALENITSLMLQFGHGAGPAAARALISAHNDSLDLSE